MKKIITLSVFTLLYAASNLFAVDKLYIVGDAIFSNWHADVAPLMYSEGNNVFSYTGWFEVGNEGFKFIQDSDWGGGYYNANASVTLTPDNPGTLTTNGAGDVKFKFAVAGFYKITCDLNNLTIMAEAKESHDEQPTQYQALFLVGEASLGGWDLDKAMRIEKQNGLTYSRDLYLKAGTFKLAISPYEEWNNDYFFFRDPGDAGKVSRDASDDRQWTINETGLYAVTIDLSDNSIQFTKKDFDKLYVVGDAVHGGWSTENIQMLNEVSPNVFSYTGWFIADQEFKFLPERILSGRVFQLMNGSGATGYVGGGATLKPDLEGNGDYKFKLDESANYTVTCDLNTMTITAEKIAYQDSEIKYAALYMVGTATPDNEFADDFPTKAVKLTSNDNNTYSATKVALTAGVFKLLTANDRGWSTTHLFRDANDDTKISTDGSGDRKWTISSAKNYDITADLANMTISIVENISTNTSNESIYSKPYLQIISQNKSVKIVLLSDYIAESIELIDITGKTITTANNVSNRIVLGNNLHSGIYLIKINIAGKSTVEKVLVK